MESLAAFGLDQVPCSDGRTARYRVGDQEFFLNTTRGWQEILPNEHNLLLQGPENADGAHPVVFVSFTGLKDVEFNPIALEAQEETYFAGRADFVREKGGTLVRKIPYLREADEEDGLEAHGVGVDYLIDGTIHYERSYYVSCDGNVFLVKSLDVDMPEIPGSANDMARTFRCGRSLRTS
jgi:hypothetical protein